VALEPSEEKRLSWSARRWRARWKNRLSVVIEPPVAAAKAAPVPVVTPEMFATKEVVPAVVEPPRHAVEEPVVVAVQPPVITAVEPVVVTAPPVLAAQEPVAVVIEPPVRAPQAPVMAAAPVAAVAAAVDDDPGFFGAGSPEAPAVVAPAAAAPKPKRHEWVELVESLRLDLERRRIEREAQEAAVPEESARAEMPAATARRAVAPQPAKNVRRISPLRGKPRKHQPAQNEWGLFDPEQCGFAALLAKLDEITHAK
jgi:hypothetical protein